MNLANGRTKPRTCANPHLNNPSKPVLVPKSCCYCSKVFINSSYLLKHLLRRHSENFLAVYRKCLAHEATDEKITRCIQSEFTALRKELALANADSHGGSPFHNHATKATQCSYSQDPHTIEKENKSTAPGSKEFCQRHKDDSFPNENQVGYVELEKEVKVLSEKLNIIECEILMKRDLRDLLTANEEKILQAQEEKLMQYKRDVLNEMNYVLQKAVNKVSSDGENQCVQLKQHISKITSDIDQIKQCMIFSDMKKEEFEKKLEEKIIRFLDTSSMKKNKQKGSKSQCDDTLVSGDFARSNSSISLMDKVPKICSELELNLPANSSGSISNRKNRNKLQEAFYDPQNKTPFLDCNYDKISAIVSAHMQSLEIPPGTTRLSYREFLEKKNKLHFKYTHWSQQKNFAQTYNKLNKFAQRKTEKRFHKKNLRVTFDVPSCGQDSFLPLKACNAEGSRQFHSTPLSKKPVRNYENSHVTLDALESSLLNPNHEVNPKDVSLGFSDFRMSSKSEDALEYSLLKPNRKIDPKDASLGFSDFRISYKSEDAPESSLLKPYPKISLKDTSLGFSDFRIGSKSPNALESNLSTSNLEINPIDEKQSFSGNRIRSKSQEFNLGQSSQFFSKQLLPVISKDLNFPPKMKDLVNNGNPGFEKSSEQNSDICLSDASSLESWSSADQKDN